MVRDLISPQNETVQTLNASAGVSERLKAQSLGADGIVSGRDYLADHFDVSRIKTYDPHEVYKTYARWPALAREGFETRVSISSRGLKKAYVLGMGGSAAGGDIIASWLTGRPGVEMAVFKGQLPIGDLRGAMAIACSASGETEETIAMMKTAVERHATVVSISAGGTLKEVSGALGIPHVQMPKIVAPRYMLPFIVFSCLSVLKQGLGLDVDAEAQESFAELEAEGLNVSIETKEPRNEAKTLARALLHKTPAVYGARITRGVGIRFKNVVNENAKKHALFDGIPDAFHNDIEAWEDPTDDFVPIFLRHTREGPNDRAREDRMVEVLVGAGKSPIQVHGRGTSGLSQLVTLSYRLDMASYYMAIGLGRDPYPTRLIDTLKRAS